MAKFSQLENGHVTVTGVLEGQNVTLEGHVKDCFITYESNSYEEGRHYIYNSQSIPTSFEYTLVFKTVDGRALTITSNEKSEDVEVKEDSDTRSEWMKGFDEGYAKGREDMRNEALIQTVKGLTTIE